MSNQDPNPLVKKMEVRGDQPLPNSDKKRSGEIDYTAMFSQQFSKLCMSSAYSDVTFIVEGQKLYAHRNVLATRSDYFQALLTDGFKESKQNEIQIPVSYEAFKALLQYIYSGVLSLNQMEITLVLDVLDLVNQYGFTELTDAISVYLHDTLTVENVCSILDSVRLYELTFLKEDCYNFIDQNASNVLKTESFNAISEDFLCALLERNTFFAKEIEIYEAVVQWFKYNPQADIKRVLNLVRFELMDGIHLLNVVRPSGLLNSEEIFDIFGKQFAKKYLNYRGSLILDENLASEKYNVRARAIEGENAEKLVKGDIKRGWASHKIGRESSCLIVELGTINIINHLKMLPYDQDCFSYYIEVSVDNCIWKRVVDYSNYQCRSWQFLYFPEIPVKFIRLVGTSSSAGSIFRCVALEAYYEKKFPRLVDGVMVPTINIATPDLSAKVLTGNTDSKVDLLNGDFKNYAMESGYEYHTIGDGGIMIQLGQPYYLDSCKILLWDGDDRSYSFYIESSVDQKNWDIIVDKRNCLLKSWQSFIFSPRPIVFIRITGTHNSANEWFHLVHFETPSLNKIQIEEIS